MVLLTHGGYFWTHSFSCVLASHPHTKRVLIQRWWFLKTPVCLYWGGQLKQRFTLTLYSSVTQSSESSSMFVQTHGPACFLLSLSRSASFASYPTGLCQYNALLSCLSRQLCTIVTDRLGMLVYAFSTVSASSCEQKNINEHLWCGRCGCCFFFLNICINVDVASNFQPQTTSCLSLIR